MQPDNLFKPNAPAKDLLYHSGSNQSKLSNSMKDAKRENKTHKSNVIETPNSASSVKSLNAPTISFTLSQFKDKRHRQMPSPPSQLDSISSFDSDTAQNQFRGGHGSFAPSLSGIQSDLFDQNNDERRHIDESIFKKPSSVFSNHLKRPSRRVETETLENLTNSNGRQTRTRIVRSALSRNGESPYAEQIIIQKIKKPF